MPSGILHLFAAARIAFPTISEVSAWAGWAFTITGQPAPKAHAVSPPAVEYANGKLAAPNTTTGPNGVIVLRKSGLGGFFFGIAVSIRTSIHAPASTAFA